MTDHITAEPTAALTAEKRAAYLAAVREALAQVLNRDASDVTEEARLFDDLGLDSSSALEMLIVIEDELDMQFEVEGLDEHISAIDPANFKKMIATAVKQFPNFKVAATTLRNAKTASVNDWSAILYAGGEFYQSMMRENLEIYDRVGGGDGFASGLAYGFLEGKGPQAAVEYGAAHGALAMTTPGDTSMVNVAEVEAVMKGKGARVIR